MLTINIDSSESSFKEISDQIKSQNLIRKSNKFKKNLLSYKDWRALMFEKKFKGEIVLEIMAEKEILENASAILKKCKDEEIDLSGITYVYFDQVDFENDKDKPNYQTELYNSIFSCLEETEVIIASAMPEPF